MNLKVFSDQGIASEIERIVKDVQRAFRNERNVAYEETLVEDSLKFYVGTRLDQMKDDLLEKFTSPQYEEFRELETILEARVTLSKAVEAQEVVQLALKFGDESVFSGHKTFSAQKLGAMMEYLSSKGHNIYKTNLNKLLFYADLSYFYLRGVGISGAVYHNRPFGPVTDPAEPILKDLTLAKRVKIVERTQTIAAEGNASASKEILSEDERKLLNWTLETYGMLGAGEISELSHLEKAYKFTEPNDPIAYAYAHSLKHLPPKSLLG